MEKIILRIYKKCAFSDYEPWKKIKNAVEN